MDRFRRIFFILGFLFTSSCAVLPKKFSLQVKQNLIKNRIINSRYLAEKSSYHYLLAELSALQAPSDHSLEQMKSAQLYDPDNLDLKVREVELLLAKGDLYKGLDRLDILLSIHVNEVALLELKGRVYEALKSYRAAEKIYIQLPNSDKVVLAQIRLAFLQEHFSKVIVLVKRSYFQDEAFLFEAQYYLAKSFEAKSQFIQAEKIYKNSLNSQIGVEIFTLFALADLYQVQKKNKKEIQLLLKYKSRATEPYLVLQRLFNLYIEQENYAQALVQAERLLEMGVGDVGFQFQVALLFIEVSRHKKAAILLEQILATNPNLDKVQVYLGFVYRQLGQLDKAKGMFALVPVKSFYYGEAVKARYKFLIDQNLDLQAEQILKEAIEKKALTLALKKDLSYFLVLHYESHQQFSKALEYGKKMIKSFPNYVNALNYVAYKWVDTNIYLPQAEALIIKAHKLEPDNPFVMDTMGWLFFKQGNYKQAQNYLELAYSKDSSLEITEHLGDVYRHFNKLSKASKLYARAFSLADLPVDKKRLQNKIQLISLVKGRGKKNQPNVFKAIIESRQPSSIIVK